MINLARLRAFSWPPGRFGVIMPRPDLTYTAVTRQLKGFGDRFELGLYCEREKQQFAAYMGQIADH